MLLPRSIVVLVVGIVLLAGTSPKCRAAPEDTSPTDVAGAYFDAMESADLDAAERLFAVDSLIFESGKVEGPWRRYREHHIGPELEHFASFKVNRGEPHVQKSADGTMAYVAWPIDYRVEFTSEREPSESLATVTFTLVLENGAYRISHLHWSRRRKS